MAPELSDADLIRIETICTAYERQLQSGVWPEFSAWVENIDEHLREELIRGLMPLDIEYRVQARQSVTLQDYTAACPDHGELVEKLFARQCGTGLPEGLAAGAVVGRFQIEHCLGTGSFAAVYQARDLETGEPVALKLLHNGTNVDDRERQLFLREAGLLRGIDHPGIVRVRDAGVANDGQPYLTMELVRGRTLRDRTQQVHPSPGWSLRIVAAAAEALACVHATGVYHRDLKPDNIIISPDDRPCLVDFGLAVQFRQRQQQQGIRAGTVPYMAPEQLVARPEELGAWTDLWALGVILFELLTGERPYSGTTAEDVLSAIHNEIRRPLSEAAGRPLPPPLQDAVDTVLTPVPAQRCQHAADLAARLRQILDEHPELDQTVEELDDQLAIQRELAAATHLWRTTGRLPGAMPWWTLRRNTIPSDWTVDERRMMRLAGRRWLRWVLMLLTGVILTGGILTYRAAGRRAELHETAVAALKSADVASWEAVYRQYETLWPGLHQELQRELDNASLRASERRNLVLARLPHEPSLTVEACRLLLSASEPDAIHLWKIMRRRMTLNQHQQVVAILRGELERFPVTTPQVAAQLPAVPQELDNRIAAANGLLARQFAFCQTLDESEFSSLDRQLSEAGYALVCRRPYAVAGRTRVAAVWHRGRREARLDSDVSTESLHVMSEGSVTASPARNNSIDEPPVTLFGRVPGSTHGQVQPAIINPDYLSDLSGLFDLTVQPMPLETTAADSLQHEVRVGRERLLVDSSDAGARFLLGRSLAFLRKDQEAISVLAWFIGEAAPRESLPFRAYVHAPRAMCLARGGARDEAFAELQKLEVDLKRQRQPTAWRTAYLSMLRALVEVYSGQTESGLRALTELGGQLAPSVDDRFYAAAGMSAAAGYLQDTSKLRVDAILRQSQSLLENLVAQNLVTARRLYSTYELATVREQPELSEWLRRHMTPLQYAAIWHSSSAFSARRSLWLVPDRHVEVCRQFAQDGYHPVSMSVTERRHEHDLVSCSVWHRSRWNEHREKRLQQRVRAAACLLALEARDLWLLLKRHRDPTLATMLLQAVADYGVSLQAVLDQLDRTEDSELRQQLLFAAAVNAADQASRTRLAQTVVRLRESTRAASVHSTVDWLLQTIGAGDSDEAAYPSDGPFGHGDLVDAHGLKLVALAPDGAIRLGTTAGDRERLVVESRYTVSNAAPWQISLLEITVAQLRAQGLSTIDEDEQLPARVTWYQAARFCNELSAAAGLDDSQYYYQPNEHDEYGPGMTARPASMQLAGFRLPTEAEWEYACRAGADSSWSIGDDSELLDRYAWFFQEQASGPFPVARLRPNGLGCFDMEGNLAEWCHEPWRVKLDPLADDGIEVIAAETQRVVRGGSFNLTRRHCRPASRLPAAPGQRLTYGFRVVRRWNPD